jgi:hypothetical protein
MRKCSELKLKRWVEGIGLPVEWHYTPWSSKSKRKRSKWESIDAIFNVYGHIYEVGVGQGGVSCTVDETDLFRDDVRPDKNWLIMSHRILSHILSGKIPKNIFEYPFSVK